MSVSILGWWRDRTGRERWLLGIMLVLLGLVIGWFGVLQPLRDARADAAARLAQASGDLADINASAATIHATEKRARTRHAAPLLDTVRQRAADAGVPAEALAGNGEGAMTLRMAAVKPAALLGWIAEIEARDGIGVDRMVLTRNADATVAVELGLRRAPS